MRGEVSGRRGVEEGSGWEDEDDDDDEDETGQGHSGCREEGAVSASFALPP